MPRIDVAVVVGGKWHDFDYVRLELLHALAATDERIRVHVAEDYNDARLLGSSGLISYTCDVRPSYPVQVAWRQWVEAGGRWLALHATNAAIDDPVRPGVDPLVTPRAFPLWADTLGSQFIAHPNWRRYRVEVASGAENDPLVAGIGSFETGMDEIHLCEYHGEIATLLQTSFTGTVDGFAESDWPDDIARKVLYRRPLGRGEVVYFTLAHCNGRWDLEGPPFNIEFPDPQRGSWDVPEYREILRRAIGWVSTPHAT